MIQDDVIGTPIGTTPRTGRSDRWRMTRRLSDGSFLAKKCKRAGSACEPSRKLTLKLT